MKKIFLSLLALVLFLMFTGCGTKDFKSELLFENSENIKSTSVSYDINSDGEAEKIEFTVTDDGYLVLNSPDGSIDLGFGELYNLHAVYGLDLDTKDGCKELALFTEEVSDDTFLRILRLNEEGFYTLNFVFGDYVADSAYIGYKADLAVSGKNKIKTSERGSFGMWSVEAEYTFDGEKFVKVKKDIKEIVRSSYAYYEDEKVAEEMGEDLINYGFILDKSEVELLKGGYVLAHEDFNGEELKCPHGDAVRLLKGDIFKITKEAADGFIYIEKKGGKSGWVYFGDFTDNRNDVSPLAFFMAD